MQGGLGKTNPGDPAHSLSSAVAGALSSLQDASPRILNLLAPSKEVGVKGDPRLKEHSGPMCRLQAIRHTAFQLTFLLG